MTLFLRKAEPSDCSLLFEWANDEVARANAFSTEPILWDDHIAWFNHMMEDASEIQYIMMRDDEPIGQVRLSIDSNSNTAEIDYSIDRFHRGYGYGKTILALVRKIVISDLTNVNMLIAKVKPTNVASYCCFNKNGFVEKYQYLECEINRKKMSVSVSAE